MMESLDDFNVRRRQQLAVRDALGPRPNGVACPQCGKELLDSDPNMRFSSSPPKMNVHCASCDYTGYRVA
jgi:hypothetical protein